MRGTLSWIVGSSVALSLIGCDTAFDPVRKAPARGTLGQELFGLVCDRVGAQSLREDVTGASFHSVCHGGESDQVDRTRLPPLTEGAKDGQGRVVELSEQQANRDYAVARIEALARRRDDLVQALDAALPDQSIPLFDLEASGSCEAIPHQEGRLLGELAATLGRMVDLYNDDTMPHVTRALGHLLESLEKDEEALAALARLDARQGYRPLEVAVGTARPILAYPRLPQLLPSLLRLVADQGPARPTFERLLGVLREELRMPAEAPPAIALQAQLDPGLGRMVLDRPRTNLELADALMLHDDPTFGDGASRYIVRRDARGVAQVALQGGAVPAPFVDAQHQGTADVDATGQFVTTSGVTVAAPFFAVEAPDGRRDAAGRALGSSGDPLFQYIDITHTFAGKLVKDLRPLLDPAPAQSLLPKLVGGLGVLLGDRDAAERTRTYPADPSRPGAASFDVRYKAFRAEASPLVDLAHALGQTLAHRDAEDALALFDILVREHPEMFARMIDLGLRLKAIADAHPEAKLPAGSMLWDEMLDILAAMAETDGVYDGMLHALADPRSRDLGPIVAAYMSHRDEITYDRHPADPSDRAALNGPSENLTTGQPVSPLSPLVTLVDRGRPDTGTNRSAFQRFLQLLHDANGLAACTKEGAVAHIKIIWPPGTGIQINLDYPTNVLARAVCGFVGSVPPERLPQCGMLRFPDVASMIIDVAIGRAKFDIRDDCLKKLMDSPLTGLVGGVNAFLEEISGIDGFNLEPTVAGVARLAFFDAPFEDWGGYPGTDLYPKTRDFLRDIIDPVPSMVCPAAPFTDSDGLVLNTRRCDSFADTLRARDRNALFPIELKFGATDFVQAIRPLATAFADAHVSPQLIRLLDTLHLHWGSSQQSAQECDPRLAKSEGRWCSGDGAVTYEPLLADMMASDLFPTVADLVTELSTINVPHCDRYDAVSRTCLAVSQRDGVTVLAEATRGMLAPSRNPGLATRAGQAYAVKNDGTRVPQTTPVYLMVDALKAMDGAFDRWEAGHSEGDSRRAGWRSLRSQLVDTFMGIRQGPTGPELANPGTTAMLPRLMEVLRAQVLAHCPDPLAGCAWAGGGLAQSLATFIEGPTLAAVMDLLEAVRAEPSALDEGQRFVAYLLDQASGQEALAATLSATVDLVQLLRDNHNLDPVFAQVARAAELPAKDGSRGLIDAMVVTFWRLFAPAQDRCTSAIDPHRTVAAFLQKLVTPIGKQAPAPIEVILSVMADVNRADPRQTGKLSAADYRNVCRELKTLLLDPAGGLEQVYTVVRSATVGAGK